ncbi:MAG: glycerol-3-phosphate ABC transporter ATP-binding protein [Candidatus Fraserbacteria bacterium RBG_16_55_9]|uniref:Glycerol-3-phosphate ABC transporter ATP-binding protein n=1 Tax=Fraserbacteria sp. (strain RBG_16_55_9) TaxID=1817864 RepID=A0A1F5UVC1_FRAXR|nr:MAG: glycerol-3-phosphate ABC transporter ATP-binding protein [Candidatus Fraserbacteria bacterium RBG_16_55_9]
MGNVILIELTKRFGDVAAIRGINLQIEEGELMVLVGPSGCGKTTLLRLIAGLEEATSGEIWIDGRLVNDMAPKDRDIAMVFQNYALYPHMSVYDNIAFGLRLRRYSRSEIDRRVQQAAGILGITDKLRSKPAELSGGQRQRVAVGRAIVREPKAFLFDEPLSNVDAQLRVQMRAELQSLHRRLKRTTLYVTHDQVEAMTLGQRVAVLKEGVLQQVDTPQRLYDHPASVFVAGFIGSPAMNFLKGQLVRQNNTLSVQGDGFQMNIPPKRASLVCDHVGREVIVGIRPGDFQPGEVGSSPDRITIRVNVIESLGSELIVYGKLSSSDVAIRLDPDVRISLDQELTLVVNTERIHLFDPDSEKTLLHLR